MTDPGSYEAVRNPKRGCDFSIPNVTVCREPSGAEQVDPGPPPEVIKGDPATCRHGVMDEMVGAYWGFEDCVSCGKRFPARDDVDYGGDDSWAG